MNVVNIVKCGICGARTNIKTQLGEVNDFYIFVPCLKCKSIINGKGHLEAPNYNFEFDFETITDCQINDFDYYSECSSELIVSKPKFLFNKDDAHIPIYFKNVDLIGKNLNREPFYLISNYMNGISKRWDNNRNLISLYINSEYKLLSENIKKNNEEEIKYETPMELCFYKHLLYRKLYDLFFSTPVYDLDKKTIELEEEILKLDVKQVDEIVNVMNEKELFEDYNYKFFALTSKIISKLVYMIPALTTQFFEKEIDFDEYGVSTCIPDHIVEIYKDCYELMGEVIPIIELLNNIKYRGKYDCYNYDGNLNKSFKETKGNRINNLNYDEYFSSVFRRKLNKTIRNSIGHSDYIYNPVTQKIIFKDKKSKNEMYLLEFMIECIENIYSLINIEKLFYFLERRNWIVKGEHSSYMLTENKKRTERNEKCPCGSGIKYKKCHGR